MIQLVKRSSNLGITKRGQPVIGDPRTKRYRARCVDINGFERTVELVGVLLELRMPDARLLRTLPPEKVADSYREICLHFVEWESQNTALYRER